MKSFVTHLNQEIVFSVWQKAKISFVILPFDISKLRANLLITTEVFSCDEDFLSKVSFLLCKASDFAGIKVSDFRHLVNKIHLHVEPDTP